VNTPVAGRFRAALVAGEERSGAPGSLGRRAGAATVQRRLPAKIQRIPQELPAWIQKTANKDKAVALMRILEEHRKAVNLDEAETTAEAILKLLGATAPDKPAESDR
jgi:hypothetical protein